MGQRGLKALLPVVMAVGGVVSAAAATTWSWDFTGTDAAERLADFKAKAQPTYARVNKDYLILKASPDKGYEGLTTATPAGTDGDRHRKCGFKVVPPAGARVKSFTLEVANPVKNGLFPLGVIADLNKTYSDVAPTSEGGSDYGVVFAARCYHSSFFSCSIGACYAAPYFNISKTGTGGGYASNAYQMDDPIKQVANDAVSFSRYNLTKAKYEVERIAETESRDGMAFAVSVTLTSKLDGQSKTCPFTVLTGSQTGDAERTVKLDSDAARQFIPAAGFGFHVYQDSFDSSAAVVQKFSVTFEGGEGEGSEGEGGGEDGEGEECDPEPTNTPPFSFYTPIDSSCSTGCFLVRATPLKSGATFDGVENPRPLITAFERTERTMKDGSAVPCWRLDFGNVCRGVAYALCGAPSAGTPPEAFVPVTNETENASSVSDPMPECEQTTCVIIRSNGDVRKTDNRYANPKPATEEPPPEDPPPVDPSSPDNPPEQGTISIANYFILPIPAQDVTGRPVKPKLRVAQTYYGSLGQQGSGNFYLTNGVELVEGRDYTVSVELCRGDPSDWSKTGSFRARAIATGCGDYTGAVSNTFTLADAEFRRTNILFEEEDTWYFFTKYYSQSGNVMTYIDRNRNGEVSYDEAALVTSLPRISKAGEGVLGVKSSHDSFAFINFFTNVTRFANYCFMSVVHPSFVSADVAFPNLQTLSGGQQGGGNTTVYYSSVAFEGCNFRRVSDLGKIPEISYSSFFNNPMIESITVPPTCTNLVEKSIERTARLCRFDVPEQVNMVGHLCFFYDGMLYENIHLYGKGSPKDRRKLVVFHGLTPPRLKNTDSVFSCCWVFVPDEAWDAYVSAPGWATIKERDREADKEADPVFHRTLHKTSELEDFERTYYGDITSSPWDSGKETW